jgi:hypothetical protein
MVGFVAAQDPVEEVVVQLRRLGAVSWIERSDEHGDLSFVSFTF